MRSFGSQKIQKNFAFELFIWVLVFTAVFSSCTNVKELRYLQGTLDSLAYRSVVIPEPIIQKGDLISIVVFSDNAAASADFNLPMTTNSQVSIAETGTPSVGSSGGSATPSVGYVVDKNGEIPFPRLGMLQVEGMTKQQLINLLDSKLKDTLLTNPYYSIRFLSLRISILGEVERPGMYTMPAEQLNILQALSMAGNLNYFGKRDNVLIIREVKGERTFGRLDLTKTDIFQSPFFQLQQNDVVVVDMRKQKVASSDQVLLRNVTLLLSIATTIALFVNLFK